MHSTHFSGSPFKGFWDLSLGVFLKAKGGCEVGTEESQQCFAKKLPYGKPLQIFLDKAELTFTGRGGKAGKEDSVEFRDMTFPASLESFHWSPLSFPAFYSFPINALF